MIIWLSVDPIYIYRMNFLHGSDGKELACDVGNLVFHPWVGKISRRRAWQPTPVFLPGESPWTEESSRLQSVGLQRVGHNQAQHSTYLSYRKLQGYFWEGYLRLLSWRRSLSFCAWRSISHFGSWDDPEWRSSTVFAGSSVPLAPAGWLASS